MVDGREPASPSRVTELVSGLADAESGRRARADELFQELLQLQKATGDPLDVAATFPELN